MVTKEYSEALVEVLEILDCLEESAKNKIPKEIIKFYEDNKSKTYVPNINFEDDISKLNVMNKTREILAGLYVDYLCENETEKQDFMNQLKQVEQQKEDEKRQKYNPDDLFKDKASTTEETALSSATKEQNFFTKILNKIKSLFKK